MTRVKICGLRRKEDIQAVNELRPDYIGFVFAKGRRQVRMEEAMALRRLLVTDIRAVGVFVDEPLERILDVLKCGVIDMVQLHGREDETYIDKLKCQAGSLVQIIKAVRMDSADSADAWQGSAADYLLLDNGAGGTGQAFDHNLIKAMRKPFFLAGGMKPANVEEAIKTVHPYAVDVSSGVETDGWKDRDKIEEIIRRVRYE